MKVPVKLYEGISPNSKLQVNLIVQPWKNIWHTPKQLPVQLAERWLESADLAGMSEKAVRKIPNCECHYGCLQSC